MAGIPEAPPTEAPTAREPTATQFVVVDASNVAFSTSMKGGKASYKVLCKIIDQLIRANLPHAVIADASLRHRIDEKLAYEGLISRRVILQAPAGRSADQFIRLLAEARKAKGQQVYVLTNDLLRQFPELAVSRIAYLAINEEEILFDPPLESVAPQRHSQDVALSEFHASSNEACLSTGGLH